MIDFNYSYYVRLEKKKAIPSANIINNIGKIIGGRQEDKLLIAYCQSLFPHKKTLFTEGMKKEKQQAIQESFSTTVIKQKELTVKQVHQIGKSKEYYYLFLILTLARNPLPKTDLQELYGKETTERILKEMQSSKLLQIIDDHVVSLASEMKFPSRDKSLDKLYNKLDEWDGEFYKFFNFKNSNRKFMIKRVTPQTLKLIEAHCNLVIDLIRSGDENRPDLLEDVIIFNLNLEKGILPG
ncbi:MAG: hypothetical protein ACPGJV_09855 [Bacteriovoracaceae bacterium]